MSKASASGLDPEAVHENSRPVDLEGPEHGVVRDLVVEQAAEAIKHRSHVDLVIHEIHGHPVDYRYDELEAAFECAALEWDRVGQCGCGGHVTCVHLQYRGVPSISVAKVDRGFAGTEVYL
ncbi:CGCGG family rSAM-modified RiPP protein [Haloterrigena salinisoli]|uniref:CGCGG family putative rSAM-modified RiPP protein n=1 Tax=Haloterrigena salinisoli TaxID=3132747 RepID=UPI0030CC0920